MVFECWNVKKHALVTKILDIRCYWQPKLGHTLVKSINISAVHMHDIGTSEKINISNTQCHPSLSTSIDIRLRKMTKLILQKKAIIIF